MQQTSLEAEIINHFRSAGDSLADEAAVLDSVIRELAVRGQQVTTKAIILSLIGEMECTSDVVKLDVLRNVLEVVVGRTPDDEGF
ncbi:regulatory protein AriR [Erwinia typographi]|uniref:Regulatory protein AriR n=1 Tax=Erwinia typographi TaxID=371042 RepID=A0A0A3Z7Z4_9GAMM|nr:biofilm development regulator YmgB/AriR family protein [Erwinia typographi]KGT95202.1 regulatory protein AriR [Erwinia typographi]